MFERNDTNRNERAQVGIGTLIVFIAMVLVAAIAAGVLINTAGFLQSSAEESGEQAAEQVTNRLLVQNAVGNTTSESVDRVNMTVRLAPGSNNVNLNETTIQWVTDTDSFNLVSDRLDNPQGDAVFNWSALRDDEGADDSSISNDDTLNSQTDRAVLHFVSTDDSTSPITLQNSADSNKISPLKAGDTVEVTINTRSGGTTTSTLVVPQSLSGKKTVLL
ncbi:flagellin [Halorhabdus sp. CBA1104]|uniref:archaellin/type IV pilin N-terminal domain-containing protein n=1 Tax=Halorhabdus sp. CBA1104 TaxID=1380432 RepID=UPI0012B40545|nr:archaellin/type IV pilin N-terminal domain-containing protein [Halorhabdus sp. CBA1104]QGN07199.1 flagellin [Halorhabdus sp. CBA1104]